MAERRPILNLDLLEQMEAELKKWDEDNPDRHFSLYRWVRFAVLSRICPYVIEEPYLSSWKRVALGKTKRKLWLFPRGHYKSSNGKGFGAFLICEPESHKWGKQVRIAVCGQTASFAKRTVQAIRQILETNAYILDNYPPMKPSAETMKEWAELTTGRVSKGAWRQDHFRTSQCILGEIETGMVMEEPTCWAQGMDQATTGYHMDVVLIDDPVGRATWKSPTKKETAREVYYDLQSQIMDGLIVIFGTRWATDDLHDTVITEYFEQFEIDSSNVWGNGKEFYKSDFKFNPDTGEYEFLGDMEDVTFFYEGVGSTEKEVRQGFREPQDVRRRVALQFVADKMHSYPASVWTKQMLNRAFNKEDLIFHDEMFRFYEQSRNLEPYPTYILTDSATGKDSRSSYRVVAAVTLDAEDIAYVREVQFGRWGPEEYMRRACIMNERYRADRMLMEQVAWQDAFKSTLRLLCEVEGRRNPRVTEVHGRSEVSKFERIETLEPRLRAGKLLFNPALQNEEFDNKNVWKELKRQFFDCKDLETSRGLLVDIPDALSDIGATDKEGARLCRPARRRREQKHYSLGERLHQGLNADRNQRRGGQFARKKPKANRMNRPSGWR